MNLNWRSQRQIIIFTTYLLMILVPVFLTSFMLLRSTASCYNNLQDGDETGTDCGGSCQLRCDGTYRDIRVDFTRGVKVADDQYDIFALLENFNTDINFPNVPYTLSAYNVDGKLLLTATGTVALYPQTKNAIYIPSTVAQPIMQEPKTIDLTLLPHKALSIFNFSDIPRNVSVENWQAQRGANNSLQVVGELSNPNSREVKNVVVYAMLYDDTRTVYAVSKTKVYSIKGREKSAVTFTWGDIISPTNVDFVVVFE